MATLSNLLGGGSESAIEQERRIALFGLFGT